MKALIFTIVLIGILALLAITNPDSEAHADYLREQMEREAGEEDELAGAIASIFGGVAESIFESATSRDNYVLFSIFTTELGSDEIVVLGILGNFVVLQEAR